MVSDKDCKHGIQGYCDACIQEAEHIRCFEAFDKYGKKKWPKEGVGFQP